MVFNGSDILLSKGNNEIVGQMDMTLNYKGAPIDVTNYSLGEWRELLDGELSAKELTIDISITFSSDAIYQELLNDSINGISDNYKITYPDGKFFVAYMMPTGLSYSANRDNSVATSMQLISGQEVFREEPATSALVTTLYPVQFFEDGPIQGTVSVSDVRPLTIIFETPIVSGTVGIDEIIIDKVLIEYTETENEVTGTVSIDSIEQRVVLIEYSEVENEVTGSVSILSIDKVEVLVPAESTENEVTGTVSISEITKA